MYNPLLRIKYVLMSKWPALMSKPDDPMRLWGTQMLILQDQMSGKEGPMSVRADQMSICNYPIPSRQTLLSCGKDQRSYCAFQMAIKNIQMPT